MMNIQTKRDILTLIAKDVRAMHILDIARSATLPDWWIGAGFVRNRVWDALHGLSANTPNDVDLVYFDPSNAFDESAALQKLERIDPSIPWEVVNQAFAHRFHGDAPYTSSADAIGHWVETATCIGVRLNTDGSLELLAPYGIEDLVQCNVRPCLFYSLDHPDFIRRHSEKGWLNRWAKLKIVPPLPS